MKYPLSSTCNYGWDTLEWSGGVLCKNQSAIKRPPRSDGARNFLTDALGSTLALTDAASEPIAS